MSCPQAPVMRMGYIHDGRVNYIRELYLHDRPANRQRMRMGYIHDGRVNYTRELYLHDRPANRQRTRMGHIHDGRVNYIREFYYTTVTCGIDSTHATYTLQIDIGSYSYRSFGDLRPINHGI